MQDMWEMCIVYLIQAALIIYNLSHIQDNHIALDTDHVGHLIPNPESHSVHPNHVNGYTKTDGTYVHSYYRDGDGNPLTELTVDQGGGYLAHDPGTFTRV